jgi:hypothetical protein
MKLNSFFIIFPLLFIYSCASSRHVRPGADGVHKVVIRGTDKESVEEQAIREAKSFCDDRHLSPAFINEETKYTGSIDETTHKTIQKISKAASVGGSMMGVFGGPRERNVGQGVMGAGAVGSIFEDKEAYTSDMKFKCI